MLACPQSLLDEGGLARDREADDDGADVGAGQEVVEAVSGA
jgi:hypothetical protein